jgi:uncharacterized repeat protein (TIGR01451 family)
MKARALGRVLVLVTIFTIIAAFWGIGLAIAGGGDAYIPFTFSDGLQVDTLQTRNETPVMDTGWQAYDTGMLVAAPVLTSTSNMTTALSVTKLASPSLVQDGAQVTYTIHITNTGSVTLTTTVTDILPGHVAPTGVLTWTPTITPFGDVWTQQTVVTVETGFTGSLTNKVQVTTEEGAVGAASVTVCANSCITYLPIIIKNRPPIFDFEGDFQGWGKHPINGPLQPGQGVTLSTEEACSGDYSLRFDDLGPYSPDSSGTTQDVGVEYDACNQKITACVLLPSGAPSIPVTIYIQDNSFNWEQGETVNLPPGKWKEVAFDTRGIPGTICPYKTLGLHFTPGDYTGPVYIDFVRLTY